MAVMALMLVGCSSGNSSDPSATGSTPPGAPVATAAAGATAGGAGVAVPPVAVPPVAAPVAGKEQEYDTFVGWWGASGSVLLTTLDILDPIALSTGMVIPGAATPPATISPKERCSLVNDRLGEIEDALLPGPTAASDTALQLGLEHLGTGLDACLAAGDETSAALGFSLEYETAHRNLLASVIGLAGGAGLEPEQIPSPPGYVAPAAVEDTAPAG